MDELRVVFVQKEREYADGRAPEKAGGGAVGRGSETGVTQWGPLHCIPDHRTRGEGRYSAGPHITVGFVGFTHPKAFSTPESRPPPPH